MGVGRMRTFGLPPLTLERIEAAKAKNPKVRKTTEIERLRLGYERYETARLMNPQMWADAWRLNISTGKAFDAIIDDLRPFIRPGAYTQADLDAADARAEARHDKLVVI